MRVKLLKKWSSYAPGCVVGVSDARGVALVAAGIGVFIGGKPIAVKAVAKTIFPSIAKKYDPVLETRTVTVTDETPTVGGEGTEPVSEASLDADEGPKENILGRTF